MLEIREKVLEEYITLGLASWLLDQRIARTTLASDYSNRWGFSADLAE